MTHASIIEFEDFPGLLARLAWRGPELLLHRCRALRQSGHAVPPYAHSFSAPHGLLFCRPDRAGDGARMAEEVRASRRFWDVDSGNDIDFTLCGWTSPEARAFHPELFLDFVRAVEALSSWRHSGETELLLLQYTVSFDPPLPLSDADGPTPAAWGDVVFDFGSVLVLPVEEMIREKKLGSLDRLMADLCRTARSVDHTAPTSAVWQISDSLGLSRVRQSVWKAALKTVLREFAEVWHQAAPYTVRDMRPG